VNHLRHAMTARGAVQWLQRPHPEFDDRRPVDELKDPDSYRRLIRIASGTALSSLRDHGCRLSVSELGHPLLGKPQPTGKSVRRVRQYRPVLVPPSDELLGRAPPVPRHPVPGRGGRATGSALGLGRSPCQAPSLSFPSPMLTPSA
jgi:hypothetical protein